MHAQAHIRGDDGRPHIQRGAFCMRRPALFDGQQRPEPFQAGLLVQLRNAHARSRTVHAAEIVHGPEQPQRAACIPIALEALKDCLAVMEHHARRIHGKRSIRHDAHVVPAMLRVIIHDQHMVGKDFSKPQFGLVRRFFLQCLGIPYRNALHIHPSLPYEHTLL